MEASAGPACPMSIEGRSEGCPDPLVDQHADARVYHRQEGRAEQLPYLCVHHIGLDQQERPANGCDNEAQVPPAAKDQAENDQGWNHDASFPCLKNTLGCL
jgi:hypothetical protein